MWRRIAEAAFWLWAHRDTAAVLADLYEKFEAADDIDTRIDVAFQIAAVGARATETQIDDKLVRALDSLRDTELGQMVLGYVRQMLAADEQRMRNQAGEHEVNLGLEAIEEDLQANALLVESEPSFASAQDDEKAKSVTLAIGIASLVFQVLRWYQERRREEE